MEPGRQTPQGPRSSPLWAALAGLVLLVTGPGSCTSRPEAPADWPHILLISLDALRADHLSSYGYGRQTTPFLDDLAGGGTRFSRAFVNTHGTPPSHTTMLTSLYQETHQVGFQTDLSGAVNNAVPDGVVMLQELLQARGYQTVAVTDGGYMSADFGFARGFDDYFDKGEGIENGSRAMLERIRRRLEQAGPIFAFLHTYEVHSPYAPPDRYRDLFGVFESDLLPASETLVPIQENAFEHLAAADFEFLKARYDAEIRYTDDVLRDFFAGLRDIGFLDNCLVVVTSDHGEEFGDHGGLLHRATLYDELLRVPLIVRGPGVAGGVVDERLVSTVDIIPTILGRLGLAADLPLGGVDLLAPDNAGTGEQRPVFSQYAGLYYSIRTPRWKLIETPHDGAVQLYDLLADPKEQHDVAPEQQAVVGELRQSLHDWRTSCPQLELTRRPVTPTADLVKRLRSLGYVN